MEQRIELVENKFFWLHPNLRFEFYISLFVSLFLLVLVFIMHESLIIVAVFFILMVQFGVYVKIIKTFFRKRAILTIYREKNFINFSYPDFEHIVKLDISNAKYLYFIVDQKSKKKKQLSYKIVCGCKQGELVLLDGLPASFFTSRNLAKIEDFFKTCCPTVDIIKIPVEELF